MEEVGKGLSKLTGWQATFGTDKTLLTSIVHDRQPGWDGAWGGKS